MIFKITYSNFGLNNTILVTKMVWCSFFGPGMLGKFHTNPVGFGTTPVNSDVLKTHPGETVGPHRVNEMGVYKNVSFVFLYS